MSGISLAVAPDGAGTVVLLDRSCGKCDTCSAGAMLWCTSLTSGRAVTTPVPAQAGPVLRDAVLLAAAVLEAPRCATVLVAAPEGAPVVRLIRSVVDAMVLAGGNLTDDTLRARVAAREPSGRASVVVTGGDGRAAVRAVRRGGHVCVGSSTSSPALPLPSVTELVQREVTLVSPRQVAEVLSRLSDDDWKAAVALATTAA